MLFKKHALGKDITKQEILNILWLLVDHAAYLYLERYKGNWRRSSETTGMYFSSARYVA